MKFYFSSALHQHGVRRKSQNLNIHFQSLRFIPSYKLIEKSKNDNQHDPLIFGLTGRPIVKHSFTKKRGGGC